jgi:hypothetical protein
MNVFVAYVCIINKERCKLLGAIEYNINEMIFRHKLDLQAYFWD